MFSLFCILLTIGIHVDKEKKLRQKPHNAHFYPAHSFQLQIVKDK